MKRLLSLSLFLMIAAVSFAHDFEAGGIYFNITSSSAPYTVAVTYKGTYYSEYKNEYTGSVTIPESVTNGGKTYRVTSIGSYAFYGCSGLTSITIPNSLTNIGDFAFCDCSGLTSITIPNSVTSISYYAFSGCSGLTSITIPNSVTSIGDKAFSRCSALTSITIPNSVTSIGDNAFYCCSGLTSITIPNSVTTIGSSAFGGCSGLKSVTIGNGVTTIDSYAFSGCSGLTSITIPNSVITIGYGAFEGCSGLTSVTIPNSVTTIDGSAFKGCSGLTSITIPNSVTNIGSSAFDGCSGLTKVIVPDIAAWCNISFGNYAANPLYYAKHIYSDENTEITDLVIPNSVTNIGGHAFRNTRLKSVTIGAGVLSISSDAFAYEYSSTGAKPVKVIWLTNTPPSGYGYVGGKVNYVANDLYTGLSNMTVYPFLSSMFEAGGVKYVPVSPSERTCDAIDFTYDAAAENINIGKTVSYKGIAMTVNNIKPYTCYQNTSIKSADVSCNGSIGDYAFYGCGSLNNVTLSNNGDIGAYAFQNNTRMISATIENNGSIGTYAFSGNTSLEKAILGDKVTSLGDYVFDGCSSLQSIDIPNGITQMGRYAFRDCSNMTSAKIGTGVTAINESTFSGCSALKDVQIGSNVRTIGDYVFSGCTSLPVINIPKAVTSIGNNTFSGCTALREVVMEDRADDTVLSLGSNGSSPMFASCPLDKVYIGRNISYNKTSNYGYSPFYRNTSLRSVTITDRETEVSENEFYGCTNLKEVKIGDGVTTIGSWAFSGCAAIDYFAFGSSVKTIGQEAFSDCTAMTRLISRAATPPSCGSQALDDINKWTCTLSVPAGSTSAYQEAAQWKEFFFIDNDVTAIEAVAAESMSNAEITAIYDLNGRRRDALQPGINIVKMSDGTTKKVVAK